MHGHCADIVNSGAFRGAAFSDGDAYFEKCAKHAVKLTSPTRFKEFQISHHVMHVLEDLAKLTAAA